MSEPILTVDRLTKRYGGLAANSDITLAIAPGEIHAIIGPNGAGKTTFIQQIAGETAPTSGRIVLAGRDITRTPAHRRTQLGLGRSFQITSIFSDFTALENVAFAAQAHAGHSYRFWAPAAKSAALNARAAATLDLVGLAGRADMLAANLAHGEHRQLEIAMALVADPKLLLLDEPTAGMGREESMRFVALLGTVRRGRTIILIEHDMDVVFAVADRITVLANGKVLATDTPAATRTNPVVREAYLGDSVAG